MQLRIRNDLRFGAINGVRSFLEKPGKDERFILTAWQLQIVTNLDGKKNTSAVVRKVIEDFPHLITPTLVWNFFQWLHKEALLDGFSDEGREFENITPEVKRSWPRLMDAEAIRRFTLEVGKVAMVLAVGLGTWKATTFVWPVLQSHSSESTAAVKTVVKPSVAHIAGSTPPTFTGEFSVSDTNGQEVHSNFFPQTSTHEVKATATKTSLDELRHELALCRVKRDVCYRTDDEDGYREQVQHIAHLTRKIGEVQATQIEQ